MRSLFRLSKDKYSVLLKNKKECAMNRQSFLTTCSLISFGLREIYRAYKRHILFSLSCRCAEKGAKRISLFLLKRVILSPEPVFSFLSTGNMYLHFLKAAEKYAHNSFMKYAEKGIGLFEDDGLHLFPFTLCRQYKKAKAMAEEQEAIRRERTRMEKKKYVSVRECRRSCENLFPISIPPL